MARGFVQRAVQGDDVGALEEPVELDIVDQALAFRPPHWVCRQHLATEAVSNLSDDRTDIAESTKGLEADARVEKLEALQSSSPKRSGLPLLQAVEELLIDPSGLKNIDQVRVARTARRAAILF